MMASDSDSVIPKICHCVLDEQKGRNLVVCIDGTSNQYGLKNTNVIELYSRLPANKDQLTYYNSGIGTYARPSWRSWHYLKKVIDNKIDLAIAWNFEKVIKRAYHWLSERFREGDHIFLFGFSRGAYQVRVLAGMIERVGLIREGNEEQIPFAYELYADLRKNASAQSDEAADHFKRTFSRQDVRVHFVGVWDTVSSIGITRGKSLPMTDSCSHVRFFRHALALDERRVKYLPECVTQPGEKAEENQLEPPRIKEVWFAGSHSDIGGGNLPNQNLDLKSVPLLWMENEALMAGLHLQQSSVEWNFDNLKSSIPYNSLNIGWWMLEWLPLRRQSHSDQSKTTR
jgi:uncharacterized protein (DUF2235 family)